MLLTHSPDAANSGFNESGKHPWLVRIFSSTNVPSSRPPLMHLPLTHSPLTIVPLIHITLTHPPPTQPPHHLAILIAAPSPAY